MASRYDNELFKLYQCYSKIVTHTKIIRYRKDIIPGFTKVHHEKGFKHNILIFMILINRDK